MLKMHQIHNSIHTFHISLAITHREKNHAIRHCHIQGRRHGGAIGGLEPPRRGGFAPPSGNLGIFVRGDLSVCTANVRVQSSSVAFTVQIPQRCELTGLLTKHPWMVVYFSSPQQQQQRHTHGCLISTLLYQ